MLRSGIGAFPSKIYRHFQTAIPDWSNPKVVFSFFLHAEIKVGVEDQDANEDQETPELHLPACLQKKDCPHCYLRYQVKRSCDQEWRKQSWILQDSSKHEEEPIENMVDRIEEQNDGESQGNIVLFFDIVLSFLTLIFLQ